MPASAAAQQPTETPIAALRFNADPVQFADAATQGAPRRFSGVAYSGGLITGHWYWDSVIFDLSSTRIPERIPALVEHDRSQRAGFAALRIANGRIEVAEGVLLDNEHGREIGNDSKAGFPWQMSVHIDPARTERVEAGKTVEVNGRNVQGPATIFRDSLIREVSFTATGADPDTSARAFSRQPSQETNDMSGSPESQARIDALQASLDAEKKAREEQATKFAQQVADAVAAAVKPLAERVDSLAKANETAFSTARKSAVEALAKDLGRKFTDDEVKAYTEMLEAQFSVVAGHLRAAKPQLPATAFSHQATGDAPAPVTATLVRSELAAVATKFAADHKAATGQDLSPAEAVRRALAARNAQEA